MKTDLEYRGDLISRGVRSDLIDTLCGADLDRVGNIVGIYRTSMEEQDPIGFRAKRFAQVRRAAPGRGDGGPAFPHMMAVGHKDYAGGMSLRDWFAGQALKSALDAIPQGIKEGRVADFPLNNVAAFAYRTADAMLAERDRR